MDNLKEKLFLVPILLITIVMHELGHGYMALWMGDETAKRDGRLSFNPLKHLDPLGVLSMLVFKFGWAKPVPINMYAFRHKKLGTFLVSVAGAAVNLIIAFIAAGIFVFFPRWNDVASLFLIYNVYFALFNLIPLPPLDGSKALVSLFPGYALERMYQIERYTYIVLIALLVFGIIPQFLQPLSLKVINGFVSFWISVGSLWIR